MQPVDIMAMALGGAFALMTVILDATAQPAQQGAAQMPAPPRLAVRFPGRVAGGCGNVDRRQEGSHRGDHI
jgi:hypothetical protein